MSESQIDVCGKCGSAPRERSKNMALSERERQVTASPTKLLITSMISVILCIGSAARAQAQDAQPKSVDESWTATTQTHVDNTNPLRTTESHSKSGNRSVDKQRVEVLGPDGRYQPGSDTETETIHVNATTTRTVVRTYGWDANGQRYLMKVTEEEARGSASGDVHEVRATSSADANGNLQVVLREVADTKKTSPDAQETKTTVYLADGNGGFTPSVQTRELQTRNAGDETEVQTTTLYPGANGNWELGQVVEETIKDAGNKRTIEDHVSRPDSEGELSEFSHTVSKETETAPGEISNTVETYSTVVPGVAQDGSLHLKQRVTTVRNKSSDRKTTEQQVEQPNPGNPTDGLQVRAKTKYTVQYAASGTQQTKTVQVRDTNGTFNVVSDETQKTQTVPPTQAPVAPSDTPK
jgi:hypothetical protein